MPQKRDVLTRIEKKLDRILKNQSALLHVEGKVAQEEALELRRQGKEVNELKELEKLEKTIDKEVKKSPLSRISLRDFYKSIIGAFIGIIGHFSFFYGVEIAENITLTRAIVLYIVAFLIGLLYVYFAGFRKVKDLDVNRFIPVRVITIYVTSIAVILLTLYLFGFLGAHSSLTEVFKNVSTISILAVLGASTADLIGGHDEH